MISLVGSRLVGAVVLLLALIAVQAVAPTLFPPLVSIALVVAPTLQWATAFFFARRAAEHPDVITLRIRAQDAFALAVASTVAAILGGFVVLRMLDIIGPISREVFVVGLAYSLLMVAAPAANWLAVWRPWRRSDFAVEP